VPCIQPHFRLFARTGYIKKLYCRFDTARAASPQLQTTPACHPLPVNPEVGTYSCAVPVTPAARPWPARDHEQPPLQDCQQPPHVSAPRLQVMDFVPASPGDVGGGGRGVGVYTWWVRTFMYVPTMCTYHRIVNTYRFGASDTRSRPGSRGSESGHEDQKREKLNKKNGKSSEKSCHCPISLSFTLCLSLCCC
jgi:hypothetical protein